MTSDDLDIGFDFEVDRIRQRHPSGGGAWVSGRIAECRFEALVYEGHADDPDWEIGESRISKLWIQRLADRRTIYNWDRGLDVPAQDDVAQAIVDFLAGGLADLVFNAGR